LNGGLIAEGPALSWVAFVEDPIAGARYSRATSIVSSAYKRHGRILEMALRESLRESNRHIPMQRKTTEKVERLKRKDNDDFRQFRSQCLCWAQDNAEAANHPGTAGCPA